MAKTFYEQAGGNTLYRTYEDPEEITYVELAEDRAKIEEVQGDSDAVRAEMALCRFMGINAVGDDETEILADFDTQLEDGLDIIKDLQDLENYETSQLNLTIKDGAWVVPIAIESVSHENPGEEAILAIDGNNGTWWQSDDASSNPRTIVFDVQDYPKRFEGFRLRISNANEDRAEIQDVTIKSSRNINNIDNAENIVATGIDFVYDGDSWMQYDFVKNLKRYIKLEIPASLHADPDQIRIREIQVRVGVTNHNTSK